MTTHAPLIFLHSTAFAFIADYTREIKRQSRSVSATNPHQQHYHGVAMKMIGAPAVAIPATVKCHHMKFNPTGRSIQIPKP
jgi:hypothetical protein